MNQRPTRKTSKPLQLNWSGCTDTGRVRKNNEDAFLGLQFDAREVRLLGKFGEETTETFDYAFAICDGMGGAKSGEFASHIAVERITRLLPHAYRQSAHGMNPGCADILSELFTQIHRALVFVGGSYEETEGMQTTLSLCWFTPGWMYFGHIGDSRIYHLPNRKSQMMQVTQDDTHVAWLLRSGKISEHEARIHPRRNVLQRALGGANQFVEPQTGAVAYERGDIFLLCTDGLVEGLYDHQLIELLRQKESENLAQLLVDTSVKNSGRDNTTALVIRVV
jgi:protein phosphatase